MDPAGASLLLAHGGGVPEVLSVLVPVGVVVALVMMERSARRRARETDTPGPDGERVPPDAG